MSRKVLSLGWVLMLAFGLVVVAAGLQVGSGDIQAANPGAVLAQPPPVPSADEYIILAWNDLGMHCYNRDFEYLAILPPANTLWVQVIKVGDPPQIITTGLTVTYRIRDNTYSVGKSNFWDYDQALYGVDLAPNMGLKGFGLSGTMHATTDHYVAEYIPLTEFTDSEPITPTYYQQALIEVLDASTGEHITGTMTVAPVSTEMNCAQCHDTGEEGNVELDILRLHDQENADEYPSEYPDLLVDTTPIRCSKCHYSNATPDLPVVPGTDIPQLSHAMHEKHLGEEDGEVPYTREGCYYCHPGPKTQCQRGTMSEDFGLTCPDCHTKSSDPPNDWDLLNTSREPWLDEPRCDTDGCHASVTYDSGESYPQDVLYRNATDHFGVYCEGCHDSTHAIAPSRLPADGQKFVQLQGNPRALRECTVCHLTEPTEAGVHGLMALSHHIFLPIIMR